MKNILVIGGAGYIGSHQVDLLVKNKYNVIVYDNLETGFEDSVSNEATFIKGDIKDFELLSSTIKQHKIDAVMHFAASSLVGESMEKPLKYFRNNVYGMQVLLEAMVATDVKYLVFSSTAAVYGNQEFDLLDENVQPDPTNVYGETKLMMENMIKWVSKINGINYVSLRYFNVGGAHPDGHIGENHNPETHLIPIVLQQPLGKREFVSVFGDDYNTPDGSCIRDYIHVCDLVEAHLSALNYLQENNCSNIFNLGYGNGYSVFDIINESEKVVGKEISKKVVERRPGDPDKLVADNSKVLEHTNWNPKFNDLNKIITDAYNWHINNPNGYEK